MVLFNYATKEITAKVVYYGPGLCGKTTNLQFVYDSLPSNNKSKMLSLATKTDRTLFFDFLPLDLGKIRGMSTKLQLYTVPGQVYYNSTRQLVLKGADGIVFVADSQDFALDANLESLQNLEDNLKRQGVRIREIPLVIQYNKRDLPNALPIAELEQGLNKLHVPIFESVATTGLGVEETLKGITQLVLAHLVKKYDLAGSDSLDKEIQILNATVTDPARATESVWEDVDEPAPTPHTATPQAAAPASTPAAAPETRIPLSQVSEGEFVLDTVEDDNLPMVPTELIAPPTAAAPPARPAPAAPAAAERGPFDEVYFSGNTNIPLPSIEIPLPSGMLDSLPELGDQRTPSATTSRPTERRSTDGLVKEVSIPLNLSLDELRTHRRLRLKITIDVNLLS